jgi:hypothetical protein
VRLRLLSSPIIAQRDMHARRLTETTLLLHEAGVKNSRPSPQPQLLVVRVGGSMLVVWTWLEQFGIRTVLTDSLVFD